MRSLLFAPADDDQELCAALHSGADGLCLHLGGATALEKTAARIAAARARFPDVRIYAQLHALDSALMVAELDALAPVGLDGFVLRQCPGGQAVQHLGARLAVKEAEYGLADRSVRILAMAGGTAASVFNMGSYVGASRRLDALLWSADDLVAALGLKTSRDPDGRYAAPFALARSLTLCAARAAGVLAIDAGCADARDDALRLDCAAARRDGFDGKLTLDRRQVEIINAVFASGC